MKKSEKPKMGHDSDTDFQVAMQYLEAAAETLSNLRKDPDTMKYILRPLVSNSTVKYKSYMVKTLVDWLYLLPPFLNSTKNLAFRYKSDTGKLRDITEQLNVDDDFAFCTSSLLNESTFTHCSSYL